MFKMAETRNVTLSLPEPLLRQFRLYAATRHQSMSSLMEEAIRKLVDEQHAEHDKAGRRMDDRMRNSPDHGIGDKIPWTRDELYDEVLNEHRVR
jgi:hypothetical protein